MFTTPHWHRLETHKHNMRASNTQPSVSDSFLEIFQAKTAHMAQIMYELLRRDSPYAVLEIRTVGSYDTAHLQSSEHTTHANFITKVSRKEVL